MSKLALTLIVVCCVGLAAWGETVRFKEYREGETVEYGFTSAVFNDTGICVSGGAGNRRGVNGDSSTMIHGQGYIALVQVRDLLTLLPATGFGADITIINAVLNLKGLGGTQSGYGEPIDCYRVTTDWLTNTDGVNTPEMDTNGNFRDCVDADVDAAGTCLYNGVPWQSGVFTEDDLDLDSLTTTTYPLTAYAYWELDVTAAVQGIYASGDNYGVGFCIEGSIGDLASPYARSVGSETTGLDARPWYEIEYSYGIVPPPLAGDLDGDGFVGGLDLNVVLNAWGDTVEAGCWLCGDPTGDGYVRGEDLNIVLNHWGDGDSKSSGGTINP